MDQGQGMVRPGPGDSNLEYQIVKEAHAAFGRVRAACMGHFYCFNTLWNQIYTGGQPTLL
jgi:hypothetical protein